MNNNIKVSIHCVTYNHEKYIAQALESFVNQKTDFVFEAVISDDCSTDKTREIIAQYAAKYPSIIKPIFREKNMGAIPNYMDTFYHLKGEYIAICEGDDFFEDEYKLQKQSDFLDMNLDCSLCFHPVRMFFEDKSYEEPRFRDDIRPKNMTFENLLKVNFIQTNSVMYRAVKYENLPDNILPGDWYMHLFHAKLGKIGFIDEVMSAYRRHESGVWWESSKGDEATFSIAFR